MDEFVNTHILSLSHWPFIASCVVLMLIGQVMKSSVWTRQRAYAKGKLQWLWWWAYKTLPLHPVIAGALVGLVWTEPESGVTGPAAMTYFAFSGALSVWLYQILKGVLKRKGIDLGTLPGQSERPGAGRADRDTPIDTPSKRPPPGAP